jgi:hypothetical protein
LRRKHVYLACFSLHFLLIVAGSCHDTLWLIAHRLTIVPSALERFAQRAERIAAAALAQGLSAANPVRRALITYQHLAGIERGYGYFAPNVPAAYKLLFEVHYADNRVEYQLPRVHSTAAGLRLTGLLDEIARTPHDRLRQYLVKMLARSIWQAQPDVVTVRAIFGAVVSPSPDEFKRGKRESYQFLYAYDISRMETTAEPKQP